MIYKRSNLHLHFLVTTLLIVMLYGCKKHKEPARHPVKVILDTDMGSDCDDAGAMALLHAYQNEGRAEILSCIYSSGKVPFGVAVVQAINVAFGRGEIPIGATHQTDVGDPLDKMGAESIALNKSLFGHTITRNTEAEEQTRLNRKILMTEPDTSVTYITIGHTRGIYDLLTSPPDDISDLSGVDLVRRKIQRWVALGALGARNAEGKHQSDWNFFMNGTAPYSQYVINNFPRPAYFVDGGGTVMTGKCLEEFPPEHILRTAYEQWLRNVEGKTLADQRPSWDLATVYFAIEGSGDFFTTDDNGHLDFVTEAGSLWVPGNRSNHHFVSQKQGVDSAFASYLNNRICKRK